MLANVCSSRLKKITFSNVLQALKGLILVIGIWVKEPYTKRKKQIN